MRALARKASKLAIYGAAGLCAQKSAASDKILKLCRNSSLAAKIGAGGLVCATPLALKLGVGVALKFAARKILTFGICELSKFVALKCAKLGARAVVRSFFRTDKFTDERTKKRASADNENFNAGVTPHRKHTASVSSASIKKDASLSKSISAKKNSATKTVPAKRSPLAKKPASVAKPASTTKSIAPAAASVSVAKSASVKSTAQNKISAASVKSAAAKNASRSAKSRRIAKNTATPVVIAAKDAAASGATFASTTKHPRRAAKSASAKSSAVGKS
ncbi:hypothetical protein [uncultured Campylobacter sp.]|uniref:hypothetical protein n=1 Tax=uncultured Campylobacter sp. TaxID=218934 RepID=UPI00261B5689|nr:hypothetical protein [uncultured Campylobacter sp.]